MFWWLKNLYWNTKRLFRWIPVIWRDREFDHSYLLQMLSFKLKLMEEFYRSEYAICADRKNCATEIHVCRLLCERLIADDYFDMLGRKYSHEGMLNFEVEDEGCQFGICKDWVHYDDYMRKQDLRYLCEILQKHLFSWWD